MKKNKTAAEHYFCANVRCFEKTMFTTVSKYFPVGAELLPGSRLQIPGTNEKFVIVRRLGEGSFGATYTAYQEDSANPNAPAPDPIPFVIKHFLYDKDSKRTQDQLLTDVEREFGVGIVLEARSQSLYSEQNGVTPLTRWFDMAANSGYILFPYVNAESLANVIDNEFHPILKSLRPIREKKVVVARALARAIDMAEALGRMHAMGVFHRDLAPRNVIVANAPNRDDIKNTYLIDYGLSCAEVAPGREMLFDELGLDEGDVVCRIRGYIDAEYGDIDQLKREQKFNDFRADASRKIPFAKYDIYALGAILNEMIEPLYRRRVRQLIDDQGRRTKNPDFPVLEIERDYVPEELKMIIRRMTGPVNQRSDGFEFAFVLRVLLRKLQDELAETADQVPAGPDPFLKIVAETMYNIDVAQKTDDHFFRKKGGDFAFLINGEEFTRNIANPISVRIGDVVTFRINTIGFPFYFVGARTGEFDFKELDVVKGGTVNDPFNITDEMIDKGVLRIVSSPILTIRQSLISGTAFTRAVLEVRWTEAFMSNFSYFGYSSSADEYMGGNIAVYSRREATSDFSLGGGGAANTTTTPATTTTAGKGDGMGSARTPTDSSESGSTPVLPDPRFRRQN